MKYIIREVDNINENVKCEYISNEESIITYNSYMDCSLIINDSYITLDFDIMTKQIMGISGFLGNIKRLAKMTLPQDIIFKNAKLIIDDNRKFEKGCGFDSDFTCDIYWDKKNNSMLLNEKSNQDELPSLWYKIASNIYVSVVNGNLKCIYLKF